MGSMVRLGSIGLPARPVGYGGFPQRGAARRSKLYPCESLAMHTYPANEQRISDVERGRSCEADVPLPSGGSLLAGDTVLFALSVSRSGQPPYYVKGGDSVLVSITGVTDLGAIDPASGQALVRIAWEPLGQDAPLVTGRGRGMRPRHS
jgi:hypothetical protein